MIPVEDEYEASKKRLQAFKEKIGIIVKKDEDGVKVNDWSMFTPVRESLMGLVGIS